MGRRPEASCSCERVHIQLVSCCATIGLAIQVHLGVWSPHTLGMLRALGATGGLTRRNVQDAVFPHVPRSTGASQQGCICPVSSPTATATATVWRHDSRAAQKTPDNYAHPSREEKGEPPPCYHRWYAQTCEEARVCRTQAGRIAEGSGTQESA